MEWGASKDESAGKQGKTKKGFIERGNPLQFAESLLQKECYADDQTI